MRESRRSMFAYICLGSNDLERSAVFYDATLGVLGYRAATPRPKAKPAGMAGSAGACTKRKARCRTRSGSARRSTARRPPSATAAMVALWAKTWARGRGLSCRGAGAWRNFGRRSRSAPAVQPGLLRGLRARSGRQQARGGVPRLHVRAGTMTSPEPQSFCPRIRIRFVVSRPRSAGLRLAFVI